MGFQPIGHKFGAIIFATLFLSGIPGAIFSPREYMMACIGSMLWAFGKLSLAKNLDDKAGRSFDYLKYMDAEWDNLGVNVIGIFVVVPQMHNIVPIFNSEVKEVEFTDLWYYGAGLLCDLLYIVILKVAAFKRKYESSPPINEEANSN